MKFLTRYLRLIDKLYIVLLPVSVLMISASNLILQRTGEGFIGYSSLISAFITTVCLALQLADKVPLSFVHIKGINYSKYTNKLGATRDDMKREYIKAMKQKAAHIAAISFPTMLILNLIGLIIVYTA
jgi:hypothetical protein